jgi:hypothetical protein
MILIKWGGYKERITGRGYKLSKRICGERDMKVLALLVTFLGTACFAQPVHFLSDSRLPVELQTLIAQELAYSCPSLIKSNSTLNEIKTRAFQNNDLETDYETYLLITMESGIRPPTQMRVLTSIYKGENRVNSYKSNGICNSIDD